MHAVRGRYAPSPTGPQHRGNLRTAILAWLQVRLNGGTFILRMEDLDQPRVVPGSAEQILQQLRWLGLDWDEGPDVGGPVGPYLQSERTGNYSRAFKYLQQQGSVYPCFCSRRDINNAASAPHGAEGPVYPGTCRDVTEDEIPEISARTGRQPAWRFRVRDSELDYVDEVLGTQRHNVAKETGDFVVLRRDGLFAYQLAVVVDDALMGISDVLRGADLAPSTPRQILLYRALGVSPPRFWHVPLMLDDNGQRLAKRDGNDLPKKLSDETPDELVDNLLTSLQILTPKGGRKLADLVDTMSGGEFLADLRQAAQTV